MAARRVAGALAPGLVTRLVGVPQLAAVVAELCVASLAAAAQLGTLGASVGDHCVAADGRGGSSGGRSESLAYVWAGSGVTWVRTSVTSD